MILQGQQFLHLSNYPLSLMNDDSDGNSQS